MNFEAPVMLVGLTAVALVVLLHLRRRRPNVIKFPGAGLLSQVARQRSPRLKVRQAILLTLRVAALASLVLAMARPSLSIIRPGGLRSGVALAQVIVLDDSLSMRQQNNGETVFERARQMALTEVGRLRPVDTSALVLSGYPARVEHDRLVADAQDVQNAISAAKIGYRGGDAIGAVRAAIQILETSDLPKREIVFVTDLAATPWRQIEELGLAQRGIDFRISAAAAQTTTDNIGIESVRTGPGREGVSKEILIDVSVFNHGATPVDGLKIVLEIDGSRVSEATLDVNPDSRSTTSFNHRFQTDGAHRGLVRIGPDALLEDNVRHFSTIVRKSLKVLIVDGDYRPGSYKDESFYLKRALETPMAGAVPIEPFVVDVETAVSSTLTGHDVVIIAGVEKVPMSLADRLAHYVKDGGGLFVAPGRNSEKMEAISSLLPATIRTTTHVENSKGYVGMGAVNRAHPVFEEFAEGHTGLEDTRVFTHLSVEPSANSKRSVIAQLSTGLPFLLGTTVGAGRSMLITTTLDRDWTDLPIRPGFLPLMHRVVQHLCGRIEEKTPRTLQVAHGIGLEVTQGMRRLVVLGPDGRESVHHGKELAGKTKIEFADTLTPGNYRVWGEIPSVGGMRELDSAGFTVVIDPDESDLSRTNPADHGIESADEAILEPLEGHLPIWPYLLLFALICLLTETVAAGAGLRKSHLQEPKS